MGALPILTIGLKMILIFITQSISTTCLLLTTHYSQLTTAKSPLRFCPCLFLCQSVTTGKGVTTIFYLNSELAISQNLLKKAFSLPKIVSFFLERSSVLVNLETGGITLVISVPVSRTNPFLKAFVIYL